MNSIFIHDQLSFMATINTSSVWSTLIIAMIRWEFMHVWMIIVHICMNSHLFIAMLNVDHADDVLIVAMKDNWSCMKRDIIMSSWNISWPLVLDRHIVIQCPLCKIQNSCIIVVSAPHTSWTKTTTTLLCALGNYFNFPTARPSKTQSWCEQHNSSYLKWNQKTEYLRLGQFGFVSNVSQLCVPRCYKKMANTYRFVAFEPIHLDIQI